MMKFVTVAIIAALLIPVPSQSAVTFVPDPVIDEPIVDEPVIEVPTPESECQCCDCKPAKSKRKPLRKSCKGVLRLIGGKK
jgi:hypothetical protein